MVAIAGGSPTFSYRGAWLQMSMTFAVSGFRDHRLHAARQSLAERALGARGGRVGERRRRTGRWSTGPDRRRGTRGFDGYVIESSIRSRGLFLNTTSPDPKVRDVRLRDDAVSPPIAQLVTVSYTKRRASWTAANGRCGADAGRNLAWMAPFVAEHYKRSRSAGGATIRLRIATRAASRGGNGDRDCMSPDEPSSRGFSLRRWSRRKLDAARAAVEPEPAAKSVPAPVPPSIPPGEAAAPIADAAPLPSIESLTIDSDFGAFLGAEVDEGLKLQALKRLFSDPHFNVMDGLDTYVGDYSIPDPIAPEIVRQLTQARYIFDPRARA